MRRWMRLVTTCGVPLLAACDRGSEERAWSRLSLATDSTNHFSIDIARDGRIAFAKPVDGAAAVFVLDSVRATPRQVTNGIWDDGPRWSPDGRWIAFERETNTLDVLIVPAEGGEPHVIASGPGREVIIGWLHDNSGVVFGKPTSGRYETWVYMLADSTARPLHPDIDGYAVPSPDGRFIAYEAQAEGVRTLGVYDVASGERRQLTSDGYESLPSGGRVWSSDSHRLAYESLRSGSSDIWVVDVVTGEQRQLTRDVREDRLPVYEHSGNRIAFISDRGGQQDVWVVADTGGEEARVTDDPAQEFSMRWMPNGEDLLIVASDTRSHLFRVAADGSNPQELTSGLDQALGLTVAPTGGRVVVEWERGGDADIAVVDSAGSEPRVIASSPAREYEPAVASDGRVAFVSARAGSPDIFVVPIDSGASRPLVAWPSREDNPQWSPDGTRLAFRSNRASTSDVWIVDSAGNDARRLTTSISVEYGIKWSGDGRRIALTGPDASGTLRVAVVDVESGRVNVLPGNNLTDPSWSPGDSLLAVSDMTDGFARIELWRPDGERVRRLSPNGRTYSRGPQFSPDGKRVAFVDYEYASDYYSLAVTPAEGGVSDLALNLKGIVLQFNWSPDGQSLYLVGAPYEPLFYRMRVPSLSATPE